MAQWNHDRRQARGENVTVSDADLQNIRPTLRQVPSNTPKNGAAPPIAAVERQAATPSGKDRQAPTTNPAPAPAKKEDVIFDVTAATFQKVVLESPVPVLVDVYADWCGPCKQLGPILENAAVKAGGMFRLAKVNSDQRRAVAEALGVTALPTVYAVNMGKLTDR